MGEVENAMTIFVVATYGEGDPTDNAQEFYEWLQNDRDDLDCVNYTVRISSDNNIYFVGNTYLLYNSQVVCFVSQ